jgi:hypothetical protein
MGINYNPNSVIDGLVLCVDAANLKSYPGSGTSVTDISGNGKNGTLTGGTSFNSNRKTFVFDGVNDTINFGIGNTVFPLPSISYEFLFRSLGTTPTTGTVPSLTGLTYGVRLLVYSTNLTATFDDGINFIELSTTGTGNFYSGSWNHVVVTHDGVNFRIYLNGVLNNSRTSTWRGNTRWPTDTFNIGRDNNDGFYHFSGDISVYRLYNKALTANEVATNFNSLRGRYGI